MRWTDLPPEPLLAPLEDAWRLMSARARAWAAAWGVATAPALLVLVDTAAVETALAAISDSRVEQGGLLIGRVHGHVDSPLRVVHVRRAVAGAGAEASAVSLRLPSATWEAARAAQQEGERVVGWFHSHPGLGAFFSDTDRSTQAAFFREAWQLGWVIDPLRQEEAWFSGAASVALTGEQVELAAPVAGQTG